MIWREPYATRIFEDLALPALGGESLAGEPYRFEWPHVLVAGFAPISLIEQGVWIRLFGERFPGAPWLATGVIAAEWSGADRVRLAESVPPSRHPSTYMLQDPAGAWAQRLEPDQAKRAFAAFVAGSEVRLLMLGPPTEEAWERFAETVAGAL